MRRFLMIVLLLPSLCLSAWSNIDTADTDTYCGRYTDIAVDSEDKMHLAYVKLDDDIECDLWYGYDSDGDNDIESNEIEKVVDDAWQCTIALDSDDHPHIVFNDASTFEFYYIYYDGSSWSTPYEIDDEGAGSIAIDSNDDIHVAYVDWDIDEIKYAKYNGSSWTYEDIDTNASGDVAITTYNNHPYVVYSLQNHGYTETYFADKSSIPWSSTEIDDEPIGSPSITADSNGDFHISGWKVITPQSTVGVVYYTDTSGSWTSSTVDAQSYSGFPPCPSGRVTYIAIDSEDHPHIAFWEYSSKDLRHAWTENGSWSWQKEDVETDANSGTYCGIAIDDDDDIYICHWKRDNSGTYTEYARVGFKSWSAPTIYQEETNCSVETGSEEKRFACYTEQNGENLIFHVFSEGSLLDGDVSLSIYDLSGRRVDTLAETTSNSLTVDIRYDSSHLSHGVYLYDIRCGLNNITGSFVQAR